MTLTGPLTRPIMGPIIGALTDACPPTWVLQTEEGVLIFIEEGATIQLEAAGA